MDIPKDSAVYYFNKFAEKFNTRKKSKLERGKKSKFHIEKTVFGYYAYNDLEDIGFRFSNKGNCQYLYHINSHEEEVKQ